jgi:hypothetical protein
LTAAELLWFWVKADREHRSISWQDCPKHKQRHYVISERAGDMIAVVCEFSAPMLQPADETQLLAVVRKILDEIPGSIRAAKKALKDAGVC